jgi:DNA-binding response OmpR family regulator
MKAKHILIAEDERMLGDMLQYELSTYGPRVTVARNGEEALASIALRRPDLLLLDLLMPKKDGYEVLRLLKDMNVDFPIVILSNLDDPREQRKCEELGAASFMVKSQVDPVDLWKKIEGYLR